MVIITITKNDVYKNIEDLHNKYIKELRLLNVSVYHINNVNLQHLFLEKINKSNESLSIILEEREYLSYSSKMLTERMVEAINDMIHLKTFLILHDYIDISYDIIAIMNSFIRKANGILDLF